MLDVLVEVPCNNVENVAFIISCHYLDYIFELCLNHVNDNSIFLQLAIHWFVYEIWIQYALLHVDVLQFFLIFFGLGG